MGSLTREYRRVTFILHSTHTASLARLHTFLCKQALIEGEEEDEYTQSELAKITSEADFLLKSAALIPNETHHFTTPAPPSNVKPLKNNKIEKKQEEEEDIISDLLDDYQLA